MSAANVLTLHEITDDLEEVAEELIENGGELTPELEERLDRVEGLFDEKVERVALFLRNLEASGEAAEAEARRLSTLGRVRKRSAKGLKSYLHVQLLRAGKRKVETPRARVRIQRNSQPSVVVSVAPEALPERFRKVTVDADRKAFLEAWKAEEGLPEGVTIERGEHLRVE